MKIGFFDSGLGGISVMEAVAQHLPQYDYVHYSDTKNVPYGDKTEAEIYELTKAGVAHLFEADCTLVILACNTACAETLRKLQDEWLPVAYPDRRVLSVIIPVIEEVVASNCKDVLLIATSRTVSSGKYHLELGKLNVIDIKVEAVATPLLVPLIKAGETVTALQSVQILIDERISQRKLDGLILGCTHYTLLASKLRSLYPDIQIFSQAEIIPKKLELYLSRHPEIESELSTGGTKIITLTRESPQYQSMIDQFLRQWHNSRFLS